MPISGQGMLITAMNVAPAHETDFNLWYDREHVAERVAIDGFVEARRYQAVNAEPAYFATYTTSAFEDLSSPAYKAALANQTEWSKTNLARALNMIRVVGRITVSKGQGRGAVMTVLRLRPDLVRATEVREQLAKQMDPAMVPGLISAHLIESNPDLSKSLTEPDKPNPGASDWFVLVEGTQITAVDAFTNERLRDTGVEVVSIGSYQLLWDLAKAEL